MTQNVTPGRAPAVASALGIDAAPLQTPPPQLWPAEGQCFVPGERVGLSRREFALLAALVAAAGHTVPRGRLYELVWSGRLALCAREATVRS